ncbi:MAG TPA: HAMP domain-containing sensor histidine kinase [Acidimicrobiales bacterium]|nr:HAMP domain-containing sensor histidine kinase [Acidimicrobiales bacterium]HVA10142.1 HAMP domain-containing sensor histidine kinase [Acidimicrobiales bacterium]
MWPGTAGRLLAIHAVILTTVLGVVTFRVVADFTSHYQRSLVGDLTAEITEYSTAADQRPTGTSLESFTSSYLRTHVLPSGRVLLIALDHVPAEGSPGSAALFRLPPVSSWLAHKPASTVIVTSSAPHRYMILGSQIRTGQTSVGLFVAAVDLSNLDAQRRQVLVLAGSEAAVALAMALLSTYLLLRRLLRTVGRVTEAAVEISRGDLDRRLGDQGADDEVGRLARTFDAMLARISAAMGSQRRLLSDVSHQLRTPLTVARGHLEVLGRGACQDPVEVHDTITVVVDELDHMRVLVDRLLLLGRALEPDFIEPEPVDLRSFLADLAETTRVLADRRWSLSPVPDLVIAVDAQKLRGALLNLIDNAVKATAPGDAIGLDVLHDADLRLGVVDSGRGMTAAQQKSAFSRFARPGATDATGSGLGLAIAKAVVEGHGGQIELESEPGNGCRVTLVLPGSCVVRFTDSGGPMP